MSRASSQRHGLPRNFGFKAMVDAVHIGHSTANPTMAESMTDFEVPSRGRSEKVSKMHFLKVAVKKLAREGSGSRINPFRSSSDEWISFRDYESRLDDHQTKSETQLQVESVRPFSEGEENLHRIRFDEARLDQLPIVEPGHVRKVVASMEEKLGIVQRTEHPFAVKSDLAPDSENDIEHVVGYREEEQVSIDSNEPQDVVQNISSFRPLVFGSSIPKSESVCSLQKPVAVVKSAGDVSVDPKTIAVADNKAKSVGTAIEAIHPLGIEKRTPDAKAGEETVGEHGASEMEANGFESDVKRKDEEMISKKVKHQARRFYIKKRDKRGKSMKEGGSSDVGDTVDIVRSATGGSARQELIMEEKSNKVKAIATDMSAEDAPNSNKCEPTKMGSVTQWDCEPLQRSVVTDHVMNVTTSQDAFHAGEEQTSTTESTRTDARNRRRRERLLGFLKPSLYRA